VAAGVAFALTRGGGTKLTRVGPRSVSVSSQQAWTDTGLVVQKGDDVSVTAAGTVYPAVPNRSLLNGPSGLANRPDLVSRSVLPTANHASLIGRVGDNGTPFNVGASTRFTASVPGRLFLGINDIGLENNDGAFQARVTIERR
jgi:hypothetical protein